MTVMMPYDSHYAALVPASAAAVWDQVRWDAPEKLTALDAVKAVECDPDITRIGARRVIVMADGSRTGERLELWDPDVFHYEYILTEAGPFPVAEYRGLVRVLPRQRPGQPEHCSLLLAARFVPVGVTFEEARSFVHGLEQQVVETVRSAFAS